MTGAIPMTASDKVEPPATCAEVGLTNKTINRCLYQKSWQLAPPSTCI